MRLKNLVHTWAVTRELNKYNLYSGNIHLNDELESGY